MCWRQSHNVPGPLSLWFVCGWSTLRVTEERQASGRSCLCSSGVHNDRVPAYLCHVTWQVGRCSPWCTLHLRCVCPPRGHIILPVICAWLLSLLLHDAVRKSLVKCVQSDKVGRRAPWSVPLFLWSQLYTTCHLWSGQISMYLCLLTKLWVCGTWYSENLFTVVATQQYIIWTQIYFKNLVSLVTIMDSILHNWSVIECPWQSVSQRIWLI